MSFWGVVGVVWCLGVCMWGGSGGGMRRRRMVEFLDKFYWVEYVKSGWVFCKKCSESIFKDLFCMVIMV